MPEERTNFIFNDGFVRFWMGGILGAPVGVGEAEGKGIVEGSFGPGSEAFGAGATLGKSDTIVQGSFQPSKHVLSRV
jgi:hypothetical protein